MAKIKSLTFLFPTHLHAEMIDEFILEVQEPVIPRHIGTVIAGTKVHSVHIDLSDIVIPEICPILGTPIDTPSIDRIDSSKGYVKGNVMICSNRANVLKNNGSLDEFRKVVAFLERGVCEINL